MAVDPDSDLGDIAGFLTRLLEEERDEEAVQMVVELLRTLRKKNTELELRVKKLLRQQFGKKGEGVSSKQLSLFLRELSDRNEDVPEDLATLDLDSFDLLPSVDPNGWADRRLATACWLKTGKQGPLRPRHGGRRS
ncbi:transposase [Myxococcota bacterium]